MCRVLPAAAPACVVPSVRSAVGTRCWARPAILLVWLCGLLGGGLPSQTAVVQADIWYVDNETGQDTNSGRTETVGPLAAGPFRTISRALAAAHQGDTIVLAKNDTPYRETITLAGRRNSGFDGQPFRIIGNGATLSGTQEILPEQWRFVQDSIYECRPADAAYQQVYLGARPATFQSVSGARLSQLEPLAWTLIDGRLYFRTDNDNLPSAYDLHCAKLQTGVTLYHVTGASIENLIVQGFWQDGINAHDNVRQTKLIGVTARGNGRSGVSVGGSSRLDVVSSLVGDNHWHQVRAEGVAQLRLLGSNVLENGQSEAQYQQDQGRISEEIPVVNTPIYDRIPARPIRQASPPTPATARHSRWSDTDTILR